MTIQKVQPPSVGDLFRPASGTHGTVRLGPSATERGPRVLLLLHQGCDICRSWSQGELGGAGDAIRGWGGRIVDLAPEIRAHDPEAAWLAVVDEWDEVFHVVSIGRDHVFPDPSDVLEWVRFVAIQCPECEAAEWPWREDTVARAPDS